MKKTAVIAFVGSLLVVGSVWASQVTNVEISFRDSSTVARIDIQGPVRFTHQTEVPKDGRPDRVIIDVLSATHELGAKEFLNLPPCIIKGVRSSQYAVSPEKIVRVVFDLKATSIYSVNSDETSIVVTFNNKEEKSFPTWSSLDALPKPQPAKPVTVAAQPVAPTQSPASAVERNQNIEKDRLASLTPKAEASKSEVAPENKAPKPSPATTAKTEENTAKTDIPATKAAEKAVPETSTEKSTVTTAQKSPDRPVEKPAPVGTKPAVKPGAEQPFVQPPFLPLQVWPQEIASQPQPTEAKPTAQLQAPALTKKSATDQTEVTPSPEPAAGAVKTPAPIENTEEESSDQASDTQPIPLDAADFARAVELPVSVNPEDLIKGAVVDTDTKSSDTTTQRATARFRREAQSDKIRGTMVAEFPQRLVIKYETGRVRDPFSPLVDDDRTFNDPVENRIPNVEGLKLVGVLQSDGGTNRALFEDKGGFSYILQTGDKVRNGYVLRVDEDQVYFQIFEYGWSRTVALTMEY